MAAHAEGGSRKDNGIMPVTVRGILVGGTSDSERNTITGNLGFGLYATGNAAGT